MRNKDVGSSVKLGVDTDTLFGLATDVRSEGVNLRDIDIGEMMNVDNFMSSHDFLPPHMPELDFDLFDDLQLSSDALFQNYVTTGIGDDSNSEGSHSTSDSGYIEPFCNSESSPCPSSSGLPSPCGPASPLGLQIPIISYMDSSTVFTPTMPSAIFHSNISKINSNVTPTVTNVKEVRKSTRGRSSSQDTPDVQAIKRQIRMIRNRESACLSRQKKKDYVVKLEAEIKELEADNFRLRQENALLKARLGLGSPSSTETKTSVKIPVSNWRKEGKRNSAKGVVGKVILLGLCTSIFLYIRAPAPPTHQEYHAEVGDDSMRHILSRTLDSPIRFRSNSSSPLGSWTETGHGKNASSSRPPVNQNFFPLPKAPANNSRNLCPLHFNQTESLRVQNDLEGLFKMKPKKPRMSKPIVYHLSQLDFQQDENKGLTVYDEKQGKYSGLLEKLERRQDTFYVLSLAVENQVLLSALAHNVSSRPKMSFLMPWRNDTRDGREELMQIDCEVTRVLNLDKGKRKRKSRK